MDKKRYSRAILDQIRNSINLTELFKRYTTLDKYNRGLCPFCKNSKHDLSLNLQKGLWYCPSCKKGGDAVTLIMLAEKVTFPIAVKVAAIDADIKLPE